MRDLGLEKVGMGEVADWQAEGIEEGHIGDLRDGVSDLKKLHYN